MYLIKYLTSCSAVDTKIESNLNLKTIVQGKSTDWLSGWLFFRFFMMFFRMKLRFKNIKKGIMISNFIRNMLISWHLYQSLRLMVTTGNQLNVHSLRRIGILMLLWLFIQNVRKLCNIMVILKYFLVTLRNFYIVSLPCQLTDKATEIPTSFINLYFTDSNIRKTPTTPRTIWILVIFMLY